jgi:hypothetical protein
LMLIGYPPVQILAFQKAELCRSKRMLPEYSCFQALWA